ncbi:MAG: chromosome partitioning protein ParB [Clostridia bacterium]|nr:chromosome partitioning protein ParB [Clostridia bacterium]
MKKIKCKSGTIELPCMDPIIVPIDKVRANNYNPNNVPKNNMELLLQSIKDNGFCFPVVTVYDPDDDVYVIVDGFHRYSIFKDYLEADEIPIVVLKQDMKQRMASTVQFNRARGVHQVELMGDLVQGLIDQGATDEEIAQHLGMELEEVFRLKQITGIAEIFKNQTYSKSWHMEEFDAV